MTPNSGPQKTDTAAKTVLVTGGAGFIGSNFVHHILAKYPGYRVLVLDALTYAGTIDNLPMKEEEDRLEFWYGNVTNPAVVDELVARADMVVHFAAESHVARSIFDNSLFYETDVLGTQCIANAVTKYRNVERFIHISTSEVYGTALTEPMAEDHQLNPLSPYASAKAGADRLVYSYWATYGIPATIIRPFNNFGPRQHLEKAIPRFITSALRGEPLTVHGTGGAARDWLYVTDTAAGIDAILHAPADKVVGEVFNLGTGIATSVMDIAEKILDRLNLGSELISHIGDRPGQVEKHIADISKVQRLVGWSPTVGFDIGLDKTIDWYRSNEDWWAKQQWMKSVPIRTADGKVELH